MCRISQILTNLTWQSAKPSHPLPFIIITIYNNKREGISLIYYEKKMRDIYRYIYIQRIIYSTYEYIIHLYILVSMYGVLFFPTTITKRGLLAPPCFCLVSITLIKYVILTRQKQGGAQPPFFPFRKGKYGGAF